ncbi:cytochrome P450 [Streptomyces sp. 769]|nr:cytochrome P450 [Streptomyces sp. 769]
MRPPQPDGDPPVPHRGRGDRRYPDPGRRHRAALTGLGAPLSRTGPLRHPPAGQGPTRLGHGPHYCLGAWLARMEIGIALGTLVERFPELQLAVPYGQLEWRESFRSHALRRLPVSLG